MRILVHSDLPTAPSGYGSQIDMLADRLIADGHDLAFKSPEEDLPVEEVKGCPVYDSEDFDRFGWPTIPRDFEDFEADVLLTLSDHWSEHDYILEFLDSDKPGIFYTVVDSETASGNATPALQVLGHPNAIPVAMSRWGQQRLLGVDGVDQVRQIPHMIDPEIYYPDQVSKQEVLNVREDTFVVSFIGRNGQRKNIGGLMEGFARFVEENGVGDAHLYVHAPKTSQHANLENFAYTMPVSDRMISGFYEVPVYGAQNFTDGDMRMIYNASDVYLHPTTAESWGLTITEALATNTPVIATNYASMTEQITDDPEVVVDREDQFEHFDHGTLLWRGTPRYRGDVSTRLYHVDPVDIADALAEYYSAWKEDRTLIGPTVEQARARYGADQVYQRDWVPFIDQVGIQLGIDLPV